MSAPPYKHILTKSGRRSLRTPTGILTAFLLVIVLGTFASQSVLLQMIGVFTLAYVAVSYADLWFTASVAEKRTMQLLFFVMTVSWTIGQFRNFPAIAHYVVTLISLFGGFVITRDLAAYLFASRLLLVVSLATIFIYLSFTGLENFPLENLIPGGSSSNGVTSYLILVQVNYCIIRYLLHRRPALITPVLTLFVCYVGFGRASLLSALGLILVNIIAASNNRNRLWVVVILAVIIPVTYFQYEEDIQFVIDTTKLGAGLYDAHRERQFEDYKAGINAATLIVGATFDGTSIAMDYNGNPHNSYIRGHHIFGLIYLISIIFFPFLLLSSRILSMQLIYPMILLLILLMRAITETILFPTMLDLFYFAVCFSMYRSLPTGNRRKSIQIK